MGHAGGGRVRGAATCHQDTEWPRLAEGSARCRRQDHRFVAGGASMGCATALWAGMAAPERIDAMVLAGMPHNQMGHPPGASRPLRFTRSCCDHEGMVRVCRSRSASAAPPVFQPYADAVDEDAEGRVPLLVIRRRWPRCCAAHGAAAPTWPAHADHLAGTRATPRRRPRPSPPRYPTRSLTCRRWETFSPGTAPARHLPCRDADPVSFTPLTTRTGQARDGGLRADLGGGRARRRAFARW